VALLRVAVFVSLTRIDRLRPHVVVRHHRLISAREEQRPRSLNRQTHAIAAMFGRHSAQLPHRILEAIAKAFETFRKTDRHVLPIRVRQHEVIDHVLERLAVNRHAQIGHTREVRGAEPARYMVLREEDFLVRAVLGQPLLHAPLQGAQLPVGETPRIAALQFLEERLGFPAWLSLEKRLDLAPNIGERVFTSPPGPRGRLLRRL
jgi:hypothetical protein